MSVAERFNATAFSRWINGSRGRAFRLVAGTAWLTFGLVFRELWWGVAAMAWSVLPLSSAVLDLCWISAALGGPLSSKSIRAGQTVRIS